MFERRMTSGWIIHPGSAQGSYLDGMVFQLARTWISRPAAMLLGAGLCGA